LKKVGQGHTPRPRRRPAEPDKEAGRRRQYANSGSGPPPLRPGVSNGGVNSCGGKSDEEMGRSERKKIRRGGRSKLRPAAISEAIGGEGGRHPNKTVRRLGMIGKKVKI